MKKNYNCRMGWSASMVAIVMATTIWAPLALAQDIDLSVAPSNTTEKAIAKTSDSTDSTTSASASASSAAYVSDMPDFTNPVDAVIDRYPAKSIRSLSQADHALADTAAAQTWFDRTAAQEMVACYKKFFVTACTDVVKERQRLAKKHLRQINTEANAFKREDKVVQRDKALAEQEQKRQEEAVERDAQAKADLLRRQQNEAKAQQGAEKNAAIQKDQALRESEQQQRLADHQKRLNDGRQQDAAKAAQAPANQAAFTIKKNDSLARQKELADQRAQNQLDLQQKNADRAEQNKGLPGSAPPIKNAVEPPAVAPTPQSR